MKRTVAMTTLWIAAAAVVAGGLSQDRFDRRVSQAFGLAGEEELQARLESESGAPTDAERIRNPGTSSRE